MKISQEDLIAFILNELEPEHRAEVADLIGRDENWKRDHDQWVAVLGTLNTDKPVQRAYPDIPDRYWNTFLPRLRERIDERAYRYDRIRERIYHAVPSFGLALVILFFLNNVLITNKKLDYLTEQYRWIRNLNSTEVIDEYIRGHISSADEILSDLTEPDDVYWTAMSEWEGSYNPTESLADDTELSPEEQKVLLENLEKTTSF